MRQYLLTGTFLCAVSTAQGQTVDLNLSAPVTDTGGADQLLMGFPYGGGSQQTLSSNGEGQAYEPGGITQSGGGITLTASPNPNTAAAWPNNLPYQSGAISTAALNNGETAQGGFAATYGIFSMKATLPAGSGLWPAFWLMPLQQGTSCEIDVMENLGQTGTIYTSLHFPGATSADSVAVAVNNTTATHTYSVDWEPSTITFFVDGQQVSQFPTPAPCNGPEYVLANLAVGGQSWSWPGQYTGGTASMHIDSITYTPGANGKILAGSGLVGGTAATPLPVATAAVSQAAPQAPASAVAAAPAAATQATAASTATPPPAGGDPGPGGPSVKDCSGNEWSVSPVAEGARILENGAIVPGGGGTSALMIQSCTVYGQDVHSSKWFTMSSTDPGADQYWSTSAAPPGAASQVATAAAAEAPATSSPAGAPTVPQTAAPPPLVCGQTATTGGFHVAGGAIIGPDGKSGWVARGINVYSDSAGASNPAAITQTFPGLNFVRYIVRSLNDPSTYDAFVTAMTSQGRAVEFENHPDGGGDLDAGPPQGIPAESAWYAAMASHYKGNPYVWFGTFNEPMPTSNLSAWQRATYDAIRGTGNNNPIMLEVSGSRPSNLQQALDPSVYATMTNVIWDPHYYPYMNNYNPDPVSIAATINATIAAAQKITSADGTVPVIIGESGPSTTGSGGPDPNGKETVEGLITVAASGTMGGLAPFTYYPGFDSSNDLTDSGGNLTSPYGQTAAIYVNNSIIACSQAELAQGAQQTLDQLTQSVTGAAPSAPSATATTAVVTPDTSASEADAQQQVDAIQAQIAATQAKLQAVQQ